MIEKIKKALIEGEDIKGLVEEALKNTDAHKILNEALIPAMEELGEKFSRKEVFVPELLFAARSMMGALEVLEPYIAGKDVQGKGRVLLGTVKGDIHSIGKNLVSMMMRSVGFEVEDAGVDIPPEEFLKRSEGFDIVGLSCLLTTSLPFLEETVRLLKEKGKRVIVGGAVVTRSFAEKIGADAYAPDAGAAAMIAKNLVGE